MVTPLIKSFQNIVRKFFNINFSMEFNIPFFFKLAIITPFFCSIIISSLLYAQQNYNKDFIQLFKQEQYAKALKILINRLNNLYEEKIDTNRVPSDIISIKKMEEEINLIHLFVNRRVKSFFIEDNQELFNLHIYCGRCYFHLARYNASLNHYYQSLRFKSLEYGKDDIYFYEISRVYKKLNKVVPYRRTLEAAYSLNTKKYEYSLELGKTLASTTEKKKAIFHLERYMNSEGNNIKDPQLYLLMGNINEDIGRYLETVKYYKKYLKFKSDDAYIHFALGFLAFKRTGDYELAIDCFDKSLSLLPKGDLFRRAKACEYKGDIYLNELEFENAIIFYQETIRFQNKIQSRVRVKLTEISKIKEQIRGIKLALIKDRNLEKYSEYEKLMDEQGMMELQNREIKYQFKKVNAGKVRWNLAESYKKIGGLEKAVKYYNEAISYNYQSNRARKNVINLSLKIKRGY